MQLVKLSPGQTYGGFLAAALRLGRARTPPRAAAVAIAPWPKRPRNSRRDTLDAACSDGQTRREFFGPLT
jgi:hypothetical protein